MKRFVTAIVCATVLAACGTAANPSSSSVQSADAARPAAKLRMTFSTVITPSAPTSVKIELVGINAHFIEELADISGCTRDQFVDAAKVTCENDDYRAEMFITAVPTFITATLLKKADGKTTDFTCKNATPPHILGVGTIVCEQN